MSALEKPINVKLGQKGKMHLVKGTKSRVTVFLRGLFRAAHIFGEADKIWTAA